MLSIIELSVMTVSSTNFFSVTAYSADIFLYLKVAYNSISAVFIVNTAAAKPEALILWSVLTESNFLNEAFEIRAGMKLIRWFAVSISVFSSCLFARKVSVQFPVEVETSKKCMI